MSKETPRDRPAAAAPAAPAADEPQQTPEQDRNKQEKEQEPELDDIVVQALANPRDTAFVVGADMQIERFVRDPRSNRLGFEPMSSYHRLLLHRIADYYRVQHLSLMQPDGNRAIVLVKNNNSRVPRLVISAMQRPSEPPAETPTQSNQPKMKIMIRKKPSKDNVSASGKKGTSTEVDAAAISLKQREEAYAKARAELFQDSEEAKDIDEAEVERDLERRTQQHWQLDPHEEQLYDRRHFQNQQMMQRQYQHMQFVSQQQHQQQHIQQRSQWTSTPNFQASIYQQQQHSYTAQYGLSRPLDNPSHNWSPHPGHYGPAAPLISPFVNEYHCPPHMDPSKFPSFSQQQHLQQQQPKFAPPAPPTQLPVQSPWTRPRSPDYLPTQTSYSNVLEIIGLPPNLMNYEADVILGGLKSTGCRINWYCEGTRIAAVFPSTAVALHTLNNFRDPRFQLRPWNTAITS